MSEKMLELKDLHKTYCTKKGAVQYEALKGISFDAFEGDFIAIMGESGSGKTTTTPVVLGIEPPSSGEVRYKGKSLSEYGRKDWKKFRQEVQAVFQNL